MLACLVLLVGVHALLEDGVDVELLPLEVDSLALEVLIDNLLLLPDDLGLARDLLQKHLHHVHLAQSQVVHL